MKECTHSRTYLGNPLCKFKSRNESLQYITYKFARRLTRWKEKALYLAGITILVKAVAIGLPTYVMQIFLLPRHICDKIDSLICKFLWRIGDQKWHLYIKACILFMPLNRWEELASKNFVTWMLLWSLNWGGECALRHTRRLLKLVWSKYLRGCGFWSFSIQGNQLRGFCIALKYSMTPSTKDCVV